MTRKQIPGFSNYYATRCGKILNQGGRLIQPYSASGYLQIKLRADDGTRKTVGVHRLVYSAFKGLIPEKLWVNHKNGIKTDNSLKNLEVLTPSENLKHASNVLGVRFGPEENTYKKRAVRILLSQGWSQNDVAKAFGISQSAVSQLSKVAVSQIL